jgi:hypothetical protein
MEDGRITIPQKQFIVLRGESESAATMSKLDSYRKALSTTSDWDEYLLKESGLPGPRANLELVQAAADLGTPEQFRRWLALEPAATPAKTALEFLPVCGAVGLGRLLAEGQLGVLPELRQHANDTRWRVREGVAMALQRWGDADMGGPVKAMKDWANGTWLERRATAAGLCEPRLLADGKHAKAVLKLLDVITRAVAKAGPADRKGDDFKALRQGLAYCWSVAVAAAPADGKAAMEKWLAGQDKDVLWIMKENLKKNRLARMDAAWVKRW